MRGPRCPCPTFTATSHGAWNWIPAYAGMTLLDQLMLHRVVHEVHVGVQAELLEDASAVGADGARRELHLLGDLVQRLAGGEHPHDPVFAVREPLVRRALLL